MSNSSTYWQQYKEYVTKTFHSYTPETPVVLAYGLNSEIAELFDVTRQEILKKKPLPKERLSELGDVLWYVAALEIFYSFPPSRYTQYFGIPFEINNAHGINLLQTQANASYYCSEISKAMTTGQADDIQYYSNKIISIVCDICAIYSVNIIDCLQASVNKIMARHPQGFDANAKKRYQEEYKTDKISIKKDGETEVLLLLKLNSKRKVPYQGIEIKVNSKSIKKFAIGDLLVDFFDASNFIAKEFEKEPYRINYDPKFREALDETVNTIYTGYIVGEELVTAKEMRSRMNVTDGRMVKVGKRARPILMTPQLQTLDHLLDYVNKRRAALTTQTTKKNAKPASKETGL